MNNIMVFENHNVEVFEFNGQVLFNPYHVGECLGLAESTVRRAIQNMNKNQVIKLTQSAVHNMNNLVIPTSGRNFLTESGVYKLIFKSRKKEAEKFADWVTDEVLPSIRKTGKYEMKPIPVSHKIPTRGITKRTYQGRPVMTIRDIEFLTEIDRQVIYRTLKQQRIDCAILKHELVRGYARENGLSVNYHDLIVLFHQGVISLLEALGRPDIISRVEEYFKDDKRQDIHLIDAVNAISVQLDKLEYLYSDLLDFFAVAEKNKNRVEFERQRLQPLSSIVSDYIIEVRASVEKVQQYI